MTSSVTVRAHCASSIEVVVEGRHQAIPGRIYTQQVRLPKVLAVLKDRGEFTATFYEEQAIYVYERDAKKERDDLQRVPDNKSELMQEAIEENARLRAALKELYAQVKGECPSLLNEDSGGDAELDIAIYNLLDAGTVLYEQSCAP